MFWFKTIRQVENLSLSRYKICMNRIDKVSDYIQGKFMDEVAKKFTEAIREYEQPRIPTTKNKKDK